MRMELAFERPLEDSFHGRYVDNPGGGRADHLDFELADEMKRDNRVDDLSSIAI
jgi:hypothetical protein